LLKLVVINDVLEEKDFIGANSFWIFKVWTLN
jgi:hypothetical protein